MNRTLIFFILSFLFSNQAFCEKHKIEDYEKYESKDVVLFGNIKKPTTITIEELKKMNVKTISLTPKSCLPSKAKDKGEEAYQGILLKDILSKAILDSKDHDDVKKIVIIAKATDNYIAIFSWGEIFISNAGNEVIVAYQKNGLPLSIKEGKIALVSAEDDRNSRHVRWLKSIEVRKL